MAEAARDWTVERWRERWRPDDDRPELLSERIDWQPAAEFLALSVKLPDYFRKVLND